MQEQAIMVSAVWRPLLTLVVASLVVMGSPGPATMSATAVGAAYGFRRSVRYVCGLIAGTAMVLFAVAIGIVAILFSIPHGAPVLLGVSAVYIIYLAFRIATAPPLSPQDRDVAAPAFLGGFLLAIANPKAYLAIAAVFAGTGHALDAMAKVAVLSLMIVIIHLCWLSAGAALSRALHHPTTARIVNITLAAGLVVVTVLALLG